MAEVTEALIFESLFFLLNKRGFTDSKAVGLKRELVFILWQRVVLYILLI